MTRIEPDDRGEVILYRTEDGRTALDVRLAGETMWLTLNQMAELYGEKNENAQGHHPDRANRRPDLYRTRKTGHAGCRSGQALRRDDAAAERAGQAQRRPFSGRLCVSVDESGACHLDVAKRDIK